MNWLGAGRRERDAECVQCPAQRQSAHEPDPRRSLRVKESPAHWDIRDWTARSVRIDALHDLLVRE